MNKKEFNKLKKWIISNIKNDLRSFTYPVIENVSENNIKRAIKQNSWVKNDKCSVNYYELQDLKDDLDIFKIIMKLKLDTRKGSGEEKK